MTPPRREFRELAAFRWLLMGLVIVAAWNPSWPSLKPPGDVVVLWDVSDSASSDGKLSSGTWVTQAVHDLPEDSRVVVVPFAAVPKAAGEFVSAAQISAHDIQRPEPETIGVPTHHTDVQAALELALELLSLSREGNILLATDGLETRGNATSALASARSAGIPVHVFIPQAGVGGSSRVSFFQVPETLPAGSLGRAEATITGPVGRPVSLALYVEGKLADRASITLTSGRATPVSLRFSPTSAGPAGVELRLYADSDSTIVTDRATGIVEVVGPTPVLYVSRSGESAPALQSLRSGGWPVTAVPPAALVQQLSGGHSPPLIVLDDLSIWDLPADAWKALDGAVRSFGSGLLVLGGPRSFGPGGYRGTSLEGLLPVTASPRPDRLSAAVLYLLDTSGSMGGPVGRVSPLAAARAALEASRATLQRSDLVGVLAFDVEPRDLLPLGPPERAEAVFDAMRSTGAGGGTRLAPALATALDRLATVETDLKFAVILTDGFAGDDPNELADLADRAAEAQVRIVPIAVGAEVDRSRLEPLAKSSGTGVLRVHRSTQIPDLIRQEIEERADPTKQRRVLPVGTQPLPFFTPQEPLPALGGYAVTRAKPGSAVYIKTEDGDPLFAVHRAGAGRVVAVPGGFGEWAGDWVRWLEWGPFLGALMEWTSRDAADPNLYLSTRQADGALYLEVDALTPDLDWWSSGRGSVRSILPGGETREVPLELVAPGRYRAAIPEPLPGRYRFVLMIGDRTVRRDVWVPSPEKWREDPLRTNTPAAWIRDGLATPWTPGESIATAETKTRETPTRGPLLCLAALLYLAILAVERLGLTRIQGRAVDALLRWSGGSPRWRRGAGEG